MRIQFVTIATLALAVAAAMPQAARAQDARAAEIIAKTRQAIGGAKLDSLKTLSLQAATTRNVGQMQMNSDLELALEMPDKYLKSETSRGGMMTGAMTTGFNGDKPIRPAGMSMMAGGAMVFRMGPGGPVPGDAPKLTDLQLAEINQTALRGARAEVSRMMLGWFAAAHPSLNAQYTYAGEAESPDGKAHVIDVKNADGFTARLFIDQNNHLPLMVTYQGRQPRMMTAGGPMGTHTITRTAPAADSKATDEERRKAQADIEEKMRKEIAEAPTVEFSLFFDDWREVDSVQFPHVLRRAAAGETTEEWTITRVKLNSKIDAKKFAVDTK